MSVPARIRVLVVEDSLTVRKRLVEVLGEDPTFLVVGEATSGEEAVERCQKLRPDVVTLDMMLDGMSGLAATERIMAHFPTPILIVSASTNRGELFCTYDALSAGAVDVLEKPRPEEDPVAWAERFRAAVRLVSRIRVIRHLRGKLGLVGQPPVPGRGPSTPKEALREARKGQPVRAIVIGASTGGPGAVVDILRALPVGFPLPLLVVVHIGGPFGASFAEWLDGQSHHRVSFAREGERLGERAVLLAPPEVHLALAGDRLRLTTTPPRHSCRPSVDALFESAAASLGPTVAGCLLTGMGRDGAAGLLSIRAAGGPTIAQDEATSVVWGMPREAVLLEAAEQVLPLEAIAPALTAIAARRWL